MKKFEQLNIVQRSQFQVLLKEKNSLSQIAKELGVTRQTLYRELQRNSNFEKRDRIGLRTSCIHFEKCRKQLANKQNKSMVCHPNCEMYEAGKRDCLKHYPFVCNYCRKRALCTNLHVYYDPENASNEYHLRITQANASPKMDTKKIKSINKIVSPLIKKGQSVEAILMSHPEIDVSALTIRNWIKKGYLDCKLSELRMNGRRVSKSYDYSSNGQSIK